MWGQINELLVQSSARIMTRIANFLPGLLALLVIISITILVTVIIRVVLRRFLRSVDFDGIVQRWGFPELAEWSPKHSPTLSAIRIVNWSIILVGVLIGIASSRANEMLVPGMLRREAAPPETRRLRAAP